MVAIVIGEKEDLRMHREHSFSLLPGDPQHERFVVFFKASYKLASYLQGRGAIGSGLFHSGQCRGEFLDSREADHVVAIL